MEEGDGRMEEDGGEEDWGRLGEEEITEIIELDEGVADDDQDGDLREVPEEDEGAESSPPPDPLPDMAAVVFRAHSKNVFSVDATSSGLVASGGEDDMGYLWDSNSGDVRLALEGHKDSVTWVRFNSKGTLLASGSMEGLIRVWDTQACVLLKEMELGSDLEWLCWHHSADIVFAGAGDGTVWMRLVQAENVKVFPGLGPACTAGVLLGDGKSLLAGYVNGSVAVWDLKSGSSTAITGGSVNFESPVTAVDVVPTEPIGAVGFEDGTVAIVNTDACKTLTLLSSAPESSENAETDGPENSVEAVKFGPTSSVLAVATVSGELQVWSLSPVTLKHRCSHRAGLTKCLWVEGSSLVTACLDGIIRLWDSRDGQEKSTWTGHTGSVLDVTTAGDQLLVSASGDNTCRVFRPS